MIHQGRKALAPDLTKNGPQRQVRKLKHGWKFFQLQNLPINRGLAEEMLVPYKQVDLGLPLLIAHFEKCLIIF